MSTSLEYDSLVADGEITLTSDEDPIENGGPRTRRRTTSGSQFGHAPDPTILINNPSVNNVEEDQEGEKERERRNRMTPPRPTYRSYLTVSILLFINLLNYMDRFTIAG
jgi:hypothetical protein